jgi:hypothetical protein
MPEERSFDGVRPGIYNVEYFSSNQAAVYIGDIFVDEVTSIAFGLRQNRRPLYGYADRYYRAVSKGQVLVEGQFSINFKEAGYMFLILDRYRKYIRGHESIMGIGNPFTDTATAAQKNIEQVFNGEVPLAQRYQTFNSLAEAYASLTGFSSTSRASGRLVDGKLADLAENEFETFENKVWGLTEEQLLNQNRSAEDPDLNPFDMYVMYGDFAGDDRMNHTIIKLEDVHITSVTQQIEADPMPISEVYQFFAKMRV